MKTTKVPPLNLKQTPTKKEQPKSPRGSGYGANGSAGVVVPVKKMSVTPPPPLKAFSSLAFPPPPKQTTPSIQGSDRKGTEDKGRVLVSGNSTPARSKRAASIDRSNIYGNLDSTDIRRSDSTDFYKAELPTICGVLADPNAKEASWDDDFDIGQETLRCK